MIYTHVLNRGGRGVRSPADALVQGLSPSQLSWNYADLIARQSGYVDIVEQSLNRHDNHGGICGPVSRNMPVRMLNN